MFSWLIVHTLTTAALAAAAAAVGRLLRLGPALRRLLWLVVLVKFLTPPVVYWPWALPRIEPARPVEAPPAPAVPAARAVRTVVIDEPPVFDAEPVESRPEPAPAAPARPEPPRLSWDWLPAAAGGAWLAGGGLVALLQAARILAWRRRLESGRAAPEWLATQVHELAASWGMGPPRLTVLAGVGSPMVWGLGAPQLIWPLSLEDRLTPEGRRAVLLHELAHLRQRDHWVAWLVLVGGCVWWWHPLFWWVRRRLTRESELACDALVVGAEPDERRAYAEALLEVSQQMASARVVPALGAAGGRRDLEGRLVMIMRGPAACRLSWAALTSVGVLGLLTLPAWTLGEDPKPAPAPKPIAASPPAAEPISSIGSALAPVALPGEQPLHPPGSAPGVQLGNFDSDGKPDNRPLQPPGSAPGVQPSAAGVGPGAAPPAGSDRDGRIQELEDRVEKLLKDIQKLRSENPGMPGAGPAPATATPQQALINFLLTRPEPVAPATEPAPALQRGIPAPTAEAESPVEVITLTRILTRVRYKLKPATAEALASFLKENVHTTSLETEIKEDTLIVTTTPEAQRAVGQFIGLIQGKPLGGGPGMPRPGGSGPLPPGSFAPPGAVAPPPALTPSPAPQAK